MTEQFVDMISMNSEYRQDLKIGHKDCGKWNKYINCDFGNALSPKASRHGHRGFEVKKTVKYVETDEIENNYAYLGSLF